MVNNRLRDEPWYHSKIKIAAVVFATIFLVGTFATILYFVTNGSTDNFTKRGCRNEQINLTCPRSHHKEVGIRIISATFRPPLENESKCPQVEWSPVTNSTPPPPCQDKKDVKWRVERACEKTWYGILTNCKIDGFSVGGIFSSAECGVDENILEVTYECHEFERRETTCEGDKIFIQCPEGEIISINSASFGMNERNLTECPFKNLGEADPYEYTYCIKSDVKDVLSEKCSGNNSCNFTANKKLLANSLAKRCITGCHFDADVAKNCQEADHLDTCYKEKFIQRYPPNSNGFKYSCTPFAPNSMNLHFSCN